MLGCFFPHCPSLCLSSGLSPSSVCVSERHWHPTDLSVWSKGQHSLRGEQRKSREPEANLITLPFPGHVGIISVFSSLLPQRTNTSQRMHIKEKEDCKAGTGGSYFYVGVKKNERSLNLPFSSLLQFFGKKDNFTGTKERKKAWEKQLFSLHI